METGWLMTYHAATHAQILKAHDLFDEFKRRVEETVEGTGCPKGKAQDLVWQNMKGVLSPLVSDAEFEGVEPTFAPHPDDAPLRDFKKSATNVLEDAKWVYDHVRIANVTKYMAPSKGAWGLLVWVKAHHTNQKEFLKMFIGMLPKPKAEEADSRLNDGTVDIEELEKFEAMLEDSMEGT